MEFKYVQLKGYSFNNKEYDTPANANNRYQEAKKPVKSWSPNTTFPQELHEEWENKGGWVGLIIPENIVLVDVDNPSEASCTEDALEFGNYEYAHIKTPHGAHFFFMLKDYDYTKDLIGKEIKNNSANITALTVTADYRTAGKGYVVLPNANTKNRHWVKELTSSTKLHELPLLLYPIINKDASVSFDNGERNSNLFAHTSRLLYSNFLANGEDISDIIHTINKIVITESLQDEEVDNIIASAIRTFESNGKQTHCNKSLSYLDTTKTLVQAKGKKGIDYQAISTQIIEDLDLGYTKNEGLMRWNGKCWDLVDFFDISKEIVHSYLLPNELQGTTKILKELENTIIREANLVTFGKNDIIVRFSLQNGTIDLTDINNIKFNEDTWFKESGNNFVLPFNFNPTADCPKYKETLNETFDDNSGLVDIISEMLGYIFYPNNSRFNKAFLLLGDAGCGKSTISKVITKLVPTSAVSALSLNEIKGFNIAQLNGKLLNYCAEQEKNSEIDDAAFKKLVSGEPINAEKKYKDGFTFYNKAKLIMASNHIPKTSDKSAGIVDRLIIIPFNRRFRGTDIENKDLDAIFDSELAGIFNFAIKGLKRLITNNKFTEVEAINDEIERFEEINDKSYEFCKYFLEYKEGAVTKTSDIMFAANEFCRENNYKNFSSESLGKSIKKLFGVAHTRRRFDGQRHYCYTNIEFVNKKF